MIQQLMIAFNHGAGLLFSDKGSAFIFVNFFIKMLIYEISCLLLLTFFGVYPIIIKQKSLVHIGKYNLYLKFVCGFGNFTKGVKTT